REPARDVEDGGVQDHRHRGIRHRPLGPPRFRRGGGPRLLHRGPGFLRPRWPVGRRTQGEGGLKLRVLSVGRDRSGWFELGVQGYAERLRRWVDRELVELPAARGALPPADARRREGEALLGRLRPDSWLVALDERGTLLDSVELSRLVATARDAGRELV